MNIFQRVLLHVTNDHLAVYGPARYRAGNLPLRCGHCRGDVFTRQRFAPYQPGIALGCENCGLIHRFVKKPERLPA